MDLLIAPRWAPPAQAVAHDLHGEQNHNIVHWSDFDRGGHFAANEAPDLLVGDMREFLAASGETQAMPPPGPPQC